MQGHCIMVRKLVDQFWQLAQCSNFLRRVILRLLQFLASLGSYVRIHICFTYLQQYIIYKACTILYNTSLQMHVCSHSSVDTRTALWRLEKYKYCVTHIVIQRTSLIRCMLSTQHFNSSMQRGSFIPTYCITHHLEVDF